MYKAEELDPKPYKVIVEFQTTVTLWETGKASYGEQVHKITISNPVSFKYHTYGKGMITYFAEWFSESVRPLRKYNTQFDTLQIKSIKFIYPELSNH